MKRIGFMIVLVLAMAGVVAAQDHGPMVGTNKQLLRFALAHPQTTPPTAIPAGTHVKLNSNCPTPCHIWASVPPGGSVSGSMPYPVGSTGVIVDGTLVKASNGFYYEQVKMDVDAKSGFGGPDWFDPTTGPPLITISVSCTPTAIEAGSSSQCAAALSGTTNTAVNWSTSQGTVSNTGLLTTTATMTGASVVKATSVADNTKFATTSVALSSPIPPPTSSAGNFVCTPSFMPVTMSTFVPANAQGVTFSINNPTPVNLTISAITIPPGFTLGSFQVPITIAPSSSQAFVVKFVPTAVGTYTGNIVFTANVPNGSIQLGLTGVSK